MHFIELDSEKQEAAEKAAFVVTVTIGSSNDLDILLGALQDCAEDSEIGAFGVAVQYGGEE